MSEKRHKEKRTVHEEARLDRIMSEQVFVINNEDVTQVLFPRVHTGL